MYCVKCGHEIDEKTERCSVCGSKNSVAPLENGVRVAESKKCGCFKGCLIIVGVLVVLAHLLIFIISVSGVTAKKQETQNQTASSTVSYEDAVRNGDELVAWIRGKKNQTRMAREDAFARLKGKTVLLSGKVRQVGKTAITDEVYVSLTVGQMDMFERINVQFNIRSLHIDKVRTWKINELHTLRGRIVGQGDFEDDACCDIAEVVE